MSQLTETVQHMSKLCVSFTALLLRSLKTFAVAVLFFIFLEALLFWPMIHEEVRHSITFLLICWTVSLYLLVLISRIMMVTLPPSVLGLGVGLITIGGLLATIALHQMRDPQDYRPSSRWINALWLAFHVLGGVGLLVVMIVVSFVIVVHSLLSLFVVTVVMFLASLTIFAARLGRGNRAVDFFVIVFLVIAIGQAWIYMVLESLHRLHTS